MRKLVTSIVLSSSLLFTPLLVLTVSIAASAGLSLFIVNDAVAQGSALYQRHSDGRIWHYTGVPCTGESCPGWQMFDNNPATVAIAVNSDGSLYQRHRDGRIWRYTGVPCTGESCPGWQMLDNNPATVAIAAGGGMLSSSN
jgi:hypothetical protein